MIKKEIIAYVNIYKCTFYACSLCITLQVPMEMSFEKFTQLTLLQKEQKLIFTFKKYQQGQNGTETYINL